MKTITNSLLIILLITFVSCEKYDSDTIAGEKLELYLLDDYETTENTLKIDEGTAILAEDVLVPYSDIVSYSKKTYSFKVSQAVMSKLIERGETDYHTKAVAVTVDKQIIYTAYLWYGYSSRICNWPAIEPLLSYKENKLEIKLAYPTDDYSNAGVDRRNDKRILKLLKRDGKLTN